MKLILQLRKCYKVIFIFSFLFTFLHFSSAQTRDWAWIKGDTTSDHFGVYGTKGLASVTNQPGTRLASMTWTDNSGNLWLFGGTGYSAAGAGLLNDLWKYDITTRQWTWISGDNAANIAGSYGTLGVADPANKPASRNGGVTWKDSSGNFWLFGGYGYNLLSGYLNDLWKYDPTSNLWTWIKGDDFVDYPAIYNIKGTAQPINTPGSRTGSTGWIDTLGNLWLFGGYGYDRFDVGNLNDVWKFDTTSRQWAWITGDSIVNKPGNQGVQGVPSATGTPGGRENVVSWSDKKQNLWIFGGDGYNASTSSFALSDLWKYNPGANQWTWITGDSLGIFTGVYGSQGIPSAANFPGARSGSAGWNDDHGNLYLYGGRGFNTAGLYYTEYGDLWKFDTLSRQWTWINGDTVPFSIGRYGVQGMSDAANKPGARRFASSWKDNAGNFWLFGGNKDENTGSNGTLNDLWRSGMLSVVPVKLVSFTAEAQDENILLKWMVEHEENLSGYEVQQGTNGKDFTTAGFVDMANLKHYSFIDPGKDNSSSTRYYRLKLIDNDGGFFYSDIITFKINNVSIFTIYPNPAQSYVTVKAGSGITGNFTLYITDLQGRQFAQRNFELNGSGISFPVDKLSAGTYFIKIKGKDQQYIEKLIVIK